MTATAVARLFGVSPQAVGLWHSRDGCPRRDDGRYDLATVIRWKVEREREGAGMVESPDLEGKYNEHQLRLQRARAEREEIALRKTKGDLIEAEEVKRREIAIARAFRAALQGLGREMAPRLYGLGQVEIEDALRARCTEILRELAR